MEAIAFRYGLTGKTEALAPRLGSIARAYCIIPGMSRKAGSRPSTPIEIDRNRFRRWDGTVFSLRRKRLFIFPQEKPYIGP